MSSFILRVFDRRALDQNLLECKFFCFFLACKSVKEQILRNDIKKDSFNFSSPIVSSESNEVILIVLIHQDSNAIKREKSVYTQNSVRVKGLSRSCKTF